MATFRDQLATYLDDYYKQRAEKTTGGDPSILTAHLSYGTAGFRGKATEIEHSFFKIGLIGALRCLQTHSNIGIMVTASHNPVQDNGVKLIDSNGEMLDPEWEPVVEKFCNLHDKEHLLNGLYELIVRYQLDVSKDYKSQVLIGYDTRPSSEALVGEIKRGLEAWSPLVSYLDYGQITTPALHFLVAESNKRASREPLQISCYYDQLIDGLNEIFGESKRKHSHYFPDKLVIDCANGVGYETMKSLMGCQTFRKNLPIKLINSGDGILNHHCGADYVKTTHRVPENANEVDIRYASLDGDADRVVYFYLSRDDVDDGDKLVLHLLDGDKIMALFAIYLKEQLAQADLLGQLSLGVVQTAYANGSSTDYITQELGLKVDFADTGVKNLHKKALSYDFGVYFEANGHGTIWVSPNARALIENRTGDNLNGLKQLLAILNNYTGDAISDVLIVETILRHYDWDIKEWDRFYQERPSSLIKVEVKDRNCIRTTNAGRTCVEPADLQAEIEKLIGQYGAKSRCFARASGTEDVVRIYAEAEDQEKATSLAHEVGEIVKIMCNK